MLSNNPKFPKEITQLENEIHRLEQDIIAINKQMQHHGASLIDLSKQLEDIELNALIMQNKLLKLSQYVKSTSTDNIQSYDRIISKFNALQGSLTTTQSTLLNKSKPQHTAPSSSKNSTSEEEEMPDWVQQSIKESLQKPKTDLKTSSTLRKESASIKSPTYKDLKNQLKALANKTQMIYNDKKLNKLLTEVEAMKAEVMHFKLANAHNRNKDMQSKIQKLDGLLNTVETNLAKDPTLESTSTRNTSKKSGNITAIKHTLEHTIAKNTKDYLDTLQKMAKTRSDPVRFQKFNSDNKNIKQRETKGEQGERRPRAK